MFKLPESYALTRNERFVYNLCANQTPKALSYTKVEIIGSLIHSLILLLSNILLLLLLKDQHKSKR